MKTITLTGNTFPARVALYNLGAEYDKVAKVWHCREDVAPRAQAIVDILTPVKASPAAKPANGSTVVVAHVKGEGPAFKALGATWDGHEKAWQVPAGKLAAALALGGTAPEAPKAAPVKAKKAPKSSKASKGAGATV